MRAMRLSVNELRAMIDRGWIGVPGTTLRREDEKKARELIGFVEQAFFLLAKTSARIREASPTMTVVDAAAGKGYVGVAIAMHSEARVIGIERDPKRVEAMLQAAAKLEISPPRIEGRSGDVADPALWPSSPDLVLSLHACRDATDLVIERAIGANARMLLIAPCCVSGDLPAAQRAYARTEAAGLERHAEVRRRLIEGYVLGERTLALESAGYKVELLPFAAPTVTPYNVAIRAVASRERERMARTTEALKRLRE